MSWYGVPVFKLVDGKPESPWLELMDSLDEAAAWMQ